MPHSTSVPAQQRRLLDLRDVNLHGSIPLLGCYDYPRAQRVLPEHRHPGTMEICYLARGRQTYSIGGRNYTLRGHDLFVTFPGETHSSGGTPEQKGRLYWIQLRLDGTGPFLHLGSGDGQVMRKQLRSIPLRHFRGTRHLQRLFDDIFLAHAVSNDPLRRLNVANRTVLLLLEVLRCAAAPLVDAPRRNLDDVLEYIGQHLHERLTLTELASRAGLSLPWFKTRFRRYTGIPPAEYILRAKVDRACQLLAVPGASITSVAATLSFASSQYFATVFKRFTGRRPTEWKARPAGDAPADSR